jgi:NADPH2:quinone reductase
MLPTMHAWRVHAFGSYREQLRWEECEAPVAPEAGVVVRVAAAALNFPDLLAIAGTYQVKAPLPFTPGIEACGIVVSAGARSRFRPGDRVIATNLWGAFAEQMPAVDQSCFAVPDDMSDADAAALLIVYQTSYFALVHRTPLAAGEVLLVHGGAGGVGTSAIQIGKALGATVIATVGSDEKAAVCRTAGADHVINYNERDFVAEVTRLTAGRGADVIYDPVGGDVFDRSMRCIAFGGRLLVIGFTSGRIPEIKANRVLLKNISVIGLHWGAYQSHQPALIHAAHEALCGLYARGAIKPVIYREMALRELPEALGLLESRASHGKIVLRP